MNEQTSLFLLSYSYSSPSHVYWVRREKSVKKHTRWSRWYQKYVGDRMCEVAQGSFISYPGMR
jgi:hypothetical protein